MSDADLRELERRFRETGSLEDEVAWLRELRRRGGDPLLRPSLHVDPGARTVRYKIAYVSPCDSKKCPATRALVLLHDALRGYAPGGLTSIASEGDRTLSFEVDLPQFDIGDLRARVAVYCASGAVYFRATRRLVTKAASGIVFVPSLVEGRLQDSYESAEHLGEDLRAHGLDPSEVPLVLQWLPGDSRPEVSPAASLRDRLGLPFRAAFSCDRNSGEGIELALFDLLQRARAAYLEARP